MGDLPIEPNVIILLVLMVFGAIKWAIENFKKTHLKEDDEEEPPISAEFEDLYEEARREIQEHQGRLYPEEEELAEKLKEYSGRPSFEPESLVPPPLPPPIPGARPPVRPPAHSPTPKFSAPPARVQLSSAEQAALERVRVGGLQITRRKTRPRAQSRVRELLASPGAARDAIILREILGSPKGMK